MVSKIAITLCLLLLIGILSADAQRDGRRRSGRRKPTTESPSPAEEPETEKNPQKLDTEPETVAKSSSAQPSESETNAPPVDKETSNSNHGGPPFIVPRGTRKPRPMHVRNNGESRPRPTLPTFARKSSGRAPKPERQDFKKTEENSLASASTSTTTSKPSRNSSRRRNNNSQTSDRGSPVEKTPQAGDSSDTATEPAPKKRFGGATRRPSRGSRRNSAPPAES